MLIYIYIYIYIIYIYIYIYIYILNVWPFGVPDWTSDQNLTVKGRPNPSESHVDAQGRGLDSLLKQYGDISSQVSVRGCEGILAVSSSHRGRMASER